MEAVTLVCVDLTAAELRILDAVERGGSFSAAASTLGLTQSAVSHSVRMTERKIGTVLFDRGRATASTGADPADGSASATLIRRVDRAGCRRWHGD